MRISYFILAAPVALLMFFFLLSRPPEASLAPGYADPIPAAAQP
jgi:hypothetical protein